MFNVIEDRGYGIQYSVFTGSLAGCKSFLNDGFVPSGFRKSWISTDNDCKNGNGDHFTYTIKKKRG